MTTEILSAQNNRVLVIDDADGIHTDFRKILAATNADDLDALEASVFGGPTPETTAEERFELDSAFQGREGLEMVIASVAAGRPYAVAFIDMRMPPGWDGLETIERCWQVAPDLQVVICTAHCDHSWDEIRRRVGNADRLLILKKPFDTVEVRQLATALTRKWNLAAALHRQLEASEVAVVERTRELEQARRQLHEVIQSTPSFMIAVDATGVVIEWNRAAEEIFGTTTADAVGHTLDSTGICWDWDLMSARIAGARDCPAPVRLSSIHFRRRSGEAGLLAVSLSSFATDRGRTLLITGEDVTEADLLARQLAQAQKLESIGQLAAGIAHEINTPIQFIGDNVRFLQTAFKQILDFDASVRSAIASSGTPDLAAAVAAARAAADLDYVGEEVPTALVQTLDGVERVARIVLAMKRFSHPGSNDIARVDINEAIRNTIVVAANRWKYVADLRTELQPDLPAVACQGGEINQVLLNLLINASDAITDAKVADPERDGRILVSTAQFADQVEISVSDNGCGIPEHVRSHMFDPFFTTKAPGRGTGQGLAIAHSVIVKKHQGSIRFETKVDVGTTFVVRLPIAGPKGDASREPT